MTEIVILAMIAVFLGLRLYSVLGRRAEHEEEPVPHRFEPKDKPGISQAPQTAQASARAVTEQEAKPDVVWSALVGGVMVFGKGSPFPSSFRSSAITWSSWEAAPKKRGVSTCESDVMLVWVLAGC